MDLTDHTTLWRISLRAEGRAPKTIENYENAVRSFTTFLRDNGLSADPATITRAHIEAWTVSLRGVLAPTTILLRWKSLAVLFRWLEDEEIIPRSPFRRIAAPAVPDRHRTVLRRADVQRILNAIDGRSFTARRDYALIAVLYETGLRAGELLALTTDDLDLVTNTITVNRSKTKPRTVGIGATTGVALGRYLRERAKHTWARHPALWLSRTGTLSYTGLQHIIKDRSEAVGTRVTAHAFRHAAAHAMLASGMGRDDLIRVLGHSSLTMVTKVYAVSLAEERAVAAHHQHSPLG